MQENFNTLLYIYDDFLDLNFDGTQNSLSPLAQIYLSGEVDNEVYKLKEMMKQPDRNHLETTMHKEVK